MCNLEVRGKTAMDHNINESGIDLGFDLSALISDDLDLDSAIDFDDLLGTPKNQEFYELTSKTLPATERWATHLSLDKLILFLLSTAHVSFQLSYCNYLLMSYTREYEPKFLKFLAHISQQNRNVRASLPYWHPVNKLLWCVVRYSKII